MKTFFRKSSLLMAILVLTFSSNVFSENTENTEENMQNMHATGLFMLSKGQAGSAEEKFVAAGKIAVLLKSWQGCVESGYGLLACNKPDESIEYFEKAFTIAEGNSDWRGCLAASVALLNMPLEFKVGAEGEKAMDSSRKIAVSSRDFYGLVEIAKVAWEMKKVDMALRYLVEAKLLAEDAQSAGGLNQIAAVYKMMGRKDEAGECYLMAKKFRKDSREIVPPPPGWSPTGETVAGPKEIPIETQKALRASADSQIDRNADEEKEAKKLKLEKEKIEAEKYQYAVAYTPYYSYPFPSYNTWRPFGYRYINSWATNRLGFYYRSGNSYFRFDYYCGHHRH
ncbi:MAG: hypothetical protein JW728_07470 [Candidatus Aureabacteria bacterium]|nr:hypothetical protein [Candidatus Auribacterota bacterium]